MDSIGQSGVKPGLIYIDTDDTLAEVTTAGYLNGAESKWGVNFSEWQMALVTTKTSPSATATQVAWLEISYSGGNWSLVPTGSPGSVTLPTAANYIAHFTNATGNLSSAAANVINPGNIQAGVSGTAGTLASYPSTASRGALLLAAVANTGNTNVTVSNAAHGQATVVSIPDGGQATTEFILADNAGTQSITSGNLSVAAGSLAASTTVTAGTGVVATTGGVRADAGNVTATTGNVTAGSDANAGIVTSFPSTTASGTLQLAAVDNAGGDFDTVISNAASVGQDQVVSIPDSGQATTEFIIADSAGTQNITSGNLAVDAGNISASAGNLNAGSDGNAGFVNSYPTTASSGFLQLQAIDNAGGDFNTVLSNAASVGQTQTVTIPDAGAATANFVLTASAAAAQSITSALNVTGGNLQASGGNVLAGSDANAGVVYSYPATTVSGTLALAAADNATGDFDTTISNHTAVGQDQTIAIPDVGQATGSFLVNVLAAADVNANVIHFDVTVGQGDLATGGTVTLQASSGSKQYKIRELYLNSGGTDFSGGGGDRLATISDGTTDYSVIPAANLQSLSNARWGDTALPFPASAAINTSSVAGTAITIAYSGGTTDYTAGSMVISGVVERVA